MAVLDPSVCGYHPSGEHPGGPGQAWRTNRRRAVGAIAFHRGSVSGRERDRAERFPTTGQRLSPPVTVVGLLQRAGDVDYFRLEARAGQEIGIQALTSTIGSKLSPILQIIDPAGGIVAESANGTLGYRCVKAGLHAIGIHDRDYRRRQ